MAKNIPTADEYFKSVTGELPDNIDWSIKDAMIAFAKLHVTAALEEALEHAPHGGTDPVTYEDVKGILTCYPLENIK